MTSTLQTPMDHTGQRASRAFALRQPDPVGIGIVCREFVTESDS